MTLGALGLLIPLISGAIALVKWWLSYVSDSSVLRRLQLYLERQKARAEVEAERLLRAYDRIDSEASKSGEDLTDALNEKFKAAPSRSPSIARRARQVALRRLLHAVRLAVLLVVLSGCTGPFRAEPKLEFPAWPKLQFSRDTQTGAQCLDEAEAQALDKWLDKLRAFEASRQRLLRGQ